MSHYLKLIFSHIEEDLEESSRKRIGTNEIIADQLKKRNRNQILNIPLVLFTTFSC